MGIYAIKTNNADCAGKLRETCLQFMKNKHSIIEVCVCYIRLFIYVKHSLYKDRRVIVFQREFICISYVGTEPSLLGS